MNEFADLPTLAALREQLAQAAQAEGPQRATPRLGWPRRALVLAVLGLLLGGATAAATLLALRGAVIPAPLAVDAGPGQVPAAASSRVLGLRAADPADQPDWALRISRSQTGLVCSTVAQVQDGDFGIVGLDGKFREVAEGAVDGCGERRENAMSLLGARVFDADRRPDVRTLVYALAGPTLRTVRVRGEGRVFRPEVGPEGTFLLALRGYPEDLALTIRLIFADGHVERHPLGRSPFVSADPSAGPAWKAQTFVIDDSPLCVSFRPAREPDHNPAISPAVCGATGARGAGAEFERTGLFLAVRRIRPGSCAITSRILIEGRWCRHPPRTAVWGFAGGDVQGIRVLGAGRPRPLVPDLAGAVLAVFDAAVDPAALRVEVRFEDGRTELFHGDTNLVRPPEDG
jgi:hypothetical protein